MNGHEGPTVVESYTLEMAAQALYLNEVTLRSWIKKDLVPGPFLYEDSRSKILLYSRGELEIIASELDRHRAGGFQNLCETHGHVREVIHQRMHAFRAYHV